jgi:phenylacetate-CoA ligase
VSGERAYWDPFWETSEPRELVPQIEERLRWQLRYVVERAPFYREKLAGLPLDLERIRLEELAELPFTSKDEVRRSQEEHGPLGGHACVGWDEVSRIHTSSGTTGNPTLVGATRRDRETWNEVMSRCMWATGVRPGDRAWVAVALGWWVAGLTFVEALQHLGAAVLPSGHTEPARTFRVLQRTGVDYVNSTPSFMKYLAGFARNELDLDPRSLGLKHIAVGGEPGGGLPQVRGQLEEAWGCPVYDNMGTADFATLIWSECEAQDGMHFLGDGLIIAELIDPLTEAPVAPEAGVRGEIVYTAIQRECTPLVRFRVGDIAEVLGTGRCRCGRTSFRIRCIGRTDDMLICQGVNIHPSAVADVVASLRPRTTGLLQIEAGGPGPSVEPPVPITVEFGEEPDLEGLAAELEQRIRRELVFRAKVQLVPSGTLARGGMKSALVRRSLEKEGPQA